MFQFKQFCVQHDRCAMKVNTDAVLLGAWAAATDPRRILDIGTGSGVIALMLAQRFPESIVQAVEIDESASLQAADNFRTSPWSNRLEVITDSITRFQATSPYDLIVSNPPFFHDLTTTCSLPRNRARHSVSLGYQELISAVERLLSPQGFFSVILPCSSVERFRALAMQQNLFCHRRCDIQAISSKLPTRSLLEFRQQPPDILHPAANLIVRSDQHREYSAEYVELTRDFYLKF